MQDTRLLPVLVAPPTPPLTAPPSPRTHIQLDITTHSGPDRRNSLGPQFLLQPYSAQSPLSTVLSTDITAASHLPRSSPVDIVGRGGTAPLVLEASSYG